MGDRLGTGRLVPRVEARAIGAETHGRRGVGRRPDQAGSPAAERAARPSPLRQHDGVLLQLNGRDLPGASCGPAARGHPGPYLNVHVGIGPRGQVAELVRGDRPAATWRIDVRVIAGAGGGFDFRGPLVEGRRGDRFIYLNWGEVDGRGDFSLFRRAKVMLSGLDPALVARALRTGAQLHCSFGLTDRRGKPTCARLLPAQVEWTVEAPRALPSARAPAH